MAGAYTVKIVEQDGTVVVSSLANVNVGPMTWTLNEVGSCQIGVPKASADAASILLLDKEIQIFRDGTLVWWGPMLTAQPEAGSAEMPIDVPELSWYFTRRQISDLRQNLLGNPQFEDGLVGWTASGVTATSDTAHYALGSRAAKLVQASYGVDTFLRQQVTVTGTSIGTLYTLAGWVYVQNTGYVGPALDSRGLHIEGIQASVVRTTSDAEIDDATPRDRWTRLETTIWVPPGETWTLDVRLYAPGGTVWWDAIQLVAMESLSHYATDMGTIAGNIVAFVQNTAHGWDDLGITTSNATTGVLLDRHYQYADHADAFQALSELEQAGLDWAMVIAASPVTRQFTSYYPKGTDRSGTVTLRMRSGTSGTLSDYRWPNDGSKVSTRVAMLGDGDGPDREEGRAVDGFELSGLMLGEVVQAPSGSPISSLQTIADKRLAASKRMVRILEVVGIPGDSTQISTLVVGDTVAVDITDGWAVISGNWRIVQKILDPVSDTCSFTLNEVAAAAAGWDGGGTSPTIAEFYDGGAASTSYTSFIDGGAAA